MNRRLRVFAMLMAVILLSGMLTVGASVSAAAADAASTDSKLSITASPMIHFIRCLHEHCFIFAYPPSALRTCGAVAAPGYMAPAICGSHISICGQKSKS